MKLWRLLLGFVLSVPVFVPLVFGANVIVSQDVTINLSGISHNFTLKSTSDALNQVEVNSNGTQFIITTSASSGSVTIVSAEGIDLGGIRGNSLGLSLTTCDATTGSSLTIIANPAATQTVTITPPAGIGCTIGGGGSSTHQSPPPSPPPGSIVQPVHVEEEVEDPLKFKDVSETKAKFVYPMVDLMLKYKTYSFPKNKKYGVKSITKGGFAVQTALAVGGHNCGSDEKYPGIKSCAKEATKLKLINSKFPTGKVQRWEYYNLLLKAKGIPLEDVKLADLKKECSDLQKPTREQANVFMTAREYGIASKYKGGKCRLHSAFSKYEAAKFALRAGKIQQASGKPDEIMQ